MTQAIEAPIRNRRLSEPEAQAETPDFFLPDLCRVQAVLLLVLVTELLALLFTLAHSGLGHFDWDYLALVSLFSQWVVLTSAALLCVLRAWLARLPLRLAAALSYALVLLVTLLFALGADSFLTLNDPGSYRVNLLFVLHSLLVSAIVTGVALRYFYLHYRWRSQQQTELQARLEALQARIRPHFLFNSMNTIASLIATDPQTAEDAVLDLAEVFRATLSQSSLLVPLEQELELCRRYLHIEQLRLGNRLQLQWQISDQARAMLVPPISLQPLVENAIYHGIQPLPQGGLVHIESYVRNGALYVLISNPCRPKSQSPGPGQVSAHQGNRMALANIRSRLDALYGEQAVLKSSQSGDVYTVTLRFPARWDDSRGNPQ